MPVHRYQAECEGSSNSRRLFHPGESLNFRRARFAMPGPSRWRGILQFVHAMRQIAGQIQSISGVLYFLAVNQFFGSATAVLSIFSVEKHVFMREFQAGYYSLTAYYLSKVLVELPHQIIFPLLLFLIA